MDTSLETGDTVWSSDEDKVNIVTGDDGTQQAEQEQDGAGFDNTSLRHVEMEHFTW